ncbi:peritrophin-44 [Drosophila guanche]|uniref:Blast:Peritrophin-44 n=1 Tax=Drosophila guanche TaxID=7266 RepID=A0A3B0JUH3_DROGU|nr:peritrophin-44 [Drosophila guanche]SPP84713.1 blast:Peritrophin-44 [Drosophila guanche]
MRTAFGAHLEPAVAVGLAMLMVLACHSPVAESIEQDICRLFSNNTVIRDPDSCSQYIKCINAVSVYGTCGGSTPFFDKEKGACVKTLTDDSTCDVSCVNATSQFVADPKSCYGYYYCLDQETPMYGSCPQETHFNETTQTCTRLYESECTASDFEYCSIVKNSVKFDNLKSCAAYHVCEKGVLKTKTCSSSYYQASTGTCVAKPLVDCVAHPLPSNVCGKASKPYANKFVSDGATCRGYFFCAAQADGTPDANPMWNHCPPDTFFDASSETCRSPNLVKCAEDRCDGRTLPFVISSTKGCRNYLRCSEGITLDEMSCGNLFFDEARGGCVPNVVSYNIC